MSRKPAFLKLFKAAQIYSLRADIPVLSDPEELSTALNASPFQRCGTQEFSRSGWKMKETEDGEDTADIIHENSDILLTVVTETKKIPARAVNEERAILIAAYVQRTGQQPKAAERHAMRVEAMQKLVTKAFTTTKETQIWIDLSSKLVIVDTAIPKQAEFALALLRKSLGSLPVIPVVTTKNVETEVTEWVKKNDYPEKVWASESLRVAKFEGLFQGSGTVNYRDEDLQTDVTTLLLESGKLISTIGLCVAGEVDVVLDSNGQLKRIAFPDEVKNPDGEADDFEQEDDDEAEQDREAMRRADFILMCDTLRNAIKRIYDALGGMAEC